MFMTNCGQKEALHDRMKEAVCTILCNVVHIAQDEDHIWWQVKIVKLVSSSDYAKILKLVKQIGV